MLLVVPVRTLLLYFGFGVCSYSMFTFLLTATPLELKFMAILLNLISVGLGVYVAFRKVVDMEHTMPEITGGCRVCRCCIGTLAYTDDALEAEDAEEAAEAAEEAEEAVEEAVEDETKEEDIYVQTTRRVEEKDGVLIVTTTYEPVSETEEVREMVEKTPTEPSPTEETAEFADLLANRKEKKEN